MKIVYVIHHSIYESGDENNSIGEIIYEDYDEALKVVEEYVKSVNEDETINYTFKKEDDGYYSSFREEIYVQDYQLKEK